MSNQRKSRSCGPADHDLVVESFTLARCRICGGGFTVAGIIGLFDVLRNRIDAQRKKEAE